jgi:hypothetical protein
VNSQSFVLGTSIRRVSCEVEALRSTVRELAAFSDGTNLHMPASALTVLKGNVDELSSAWLEALNAITTALLTSGKTISTTTSESTQSPTPDPATPSAPNTKTTASPGSNVFPFPTKEGA